MCFLILNWTTALSCPNTLRLMCSVSEPLLSCKENGRYNQTHTFGGISHWGGGGRIPRCGCCCIGNNNNEHAKQHGRWGASPGERVHIIGVRRAVLEVVVHWTMYSGRKDDPFEATPSAERWGNNLKDADDAPVSAATYFHE